MVISTHRVDNGDSTPTAIKTLSALAVSAYYSLTYRAHSTIIQHDNITVTSQCHPSAPSEYI